MKIAGKGKKAGAKKNMELAAIQKKPLKAPLKAMGRESLAAAPAAQAVAGQLEKIAPLAAPKREKEEDYFSDGSLAHALSYPEDVFGEGFPDDELCGYLSRNLFRLERDVAFFRFAVKEIEDITGK